MYLNGLHSEHTKDIFVLVPKWQLEKAHIVLRGALKLALTSP